MKKRKEKSRKKKKRITTGIHNLDKLIQGGFEEYSVNMVVGDTGSGKTVFAMQFIVEGLKRGDKCLYVAFEEKKEEIYSNMLEFGWDLEKYEKQGKFFFLEYNPEKVKVMLEEGGGEIETIVSKHEINRLVIDSVTSFALLFETDRTEGESSTLEFEADSIILFYFLRVDHERERFLEVLKMRGTKHSTKIYCLTIGKKGIAIGKPATKLKDFPKY